MIGTPDFPLRSVDRGSWRWGARCRTADTADFFADSKGIPELVVQEWCQPCPVRRECLLEELDATGHKVGQQEGVRALTASDRKRLIRWLIDQDRDGFTPTPADIEGFDSSRLEVSA